jgi:hypothetical protein
MIERIHEFEVWSTSGKQLPVDYGKFLRDELLANGTFTIFAIPDNVFFGLSNIPDKIDVQNLEMDFKEGVLTLEGFNEFCCRYGYEQNPKSELSANKYLEYVNGCPIAWVHIPENNVDKILPLIIKLMKEKGHIIIEPKTGKSFDINSDGLVVCV